MTEPTSEVTPWIYFANEEIARGDGFLASLSDLDLCILFCDSGFMMRPDQRIPDAPVVGAVCGRGYGKSDMFARHVNDGVEAGDYRCIGLLAQDDERTVSVQVQPLVDLSPPWFKAAHIGNQVVWPNEAVAHIRTPESPGKIRGANYDLTWASELVAWKKATAIKAWDNVTTATRVGKARILFDTTSEGRNDLIDKVFALHEYDNKKYPIIRGTLFHNPIYSKDYIQRTALSYSGQRYDEEVLGKVFRGTPGALFFQETIDEDRVEAAPKLVLVLAASDPAITTRESSDLTGFIVGGMCRDGHIYIMQDTSGRLTPEDHGEAVHDAWKAGASGAVVETNRGGSYVTSGIRAVFKEHGARVVVIEKGRRLPRRSTTAAYIREVHARGAKNSAERAGGPSALYAQHKVHHVGHFPELEKELTTFEPGASESPNRYDACMHLITELSGINTDKPSNASREQDAKSTARANTDLRDRLRRIGRNRSLL